MKGLIWKTEKRKVAELKPYPKNAKKHPAKQIEQIAASIREFGFNQPVVVDEDGVIIVGHGRYEAAKLLGLSEVPVIEAKLSKEKAKAYRLADNKLNESGWDLDLALDDLRELSDELFDLTGFDRDLLLEEDERDDIVPQVPKKPKSKLGDIYLLGSHRVMCGDSTKAEDVERLMDGKKADMVFTDPPYGVNYDGGHATIKRREKLKGDDNVALYKPASVSAMENSKSGAAFYLFHAGVKGFQAAAAAAGWEIRSELIWNKNMAQFGAIGAQYKQKHEPFYYCYKKGLRPQWFGANNEVTVWDCNRAAKNEFHPTQKPVELVTRALVNSSKENDIVLDLFLGSGSTLIASQKTGRVCFGMELCESYVDVIIQRYVDYTGNTKVIKDGKEIEWKR